MHPRPTPCTASHPSHQRGWPAWDCPLCGRPLEVTLRAKDAEPGCNRLHSDDQLHCNHCDFLAYGNVTARLKALAGVSRACPECSGSSVCPCCLARGHAKPAPRPRPGKPQRQAVSA